MFYTAYSEKNQLPKGKIMKIRTIGKVVTVVTASTTATIATDRLIGKVNQDLNSDTIVSDQYRALTDAAVGLNTAYVAGIVYDKVVDSANAKITHRISHSKIFFK